MNILGSNPHLTYITARKILLRELKNIDYQPALITWAKWVISLVNSSCYA